MGGFLSVISAPRRLPTVKPANAALNGANSVEPARLPAIAAPDQTEAVAQVEDVLRRGRGRASTVTSSYRGVLLPETALSEKLTPTRKTLLGE